MEGSQNKSSIVIYILILIAGGLIGWFSHEGFAGGSVSSKQTQPPVSLADITINQNTMNEVGIPECQRAFIGKWKGTWNKGSGLSQYYVEAVFAVTDITAERKAKVVYSWGGNSTLKLDAGEYVGEGTFADDGTLMVRLPGANSTNEEVIVSFRTADNVGERLTGTYQIASQPSVTGVFDKVK
jgi:hypothetical protein